MTINNINSILIKTEDESNIHSLGLSHNIAEEKSIVHQSYNSYFITQRQFSISFSYPDIGDFIVLRKVFDFFGK